MWAVVTAISDRWVARWSRPDPHALDAVAGLAPAVVVTGGSRGIGFAIAARFAAIGNTHILLVAREQVSLADAARRISELHGVNVYTLAQDVADPGAPAAIDSALAAHGLYLDVLVNNAGLGLSGRFDSAAPEAVDALIAVNVAAVARLMRHALPGLRARGRGGILNIASLGGYVPGPYQAAYYASKAFVISLSESVAFEVRGLGVRVAVVAPGPVTTDFHDKMGSADALYRTLLSSSSPERIAVIAVRGFLLGRRVIVPGLLESAQAIVLRLAPHAVSIPFIAGLLGARVGSKK